MRSKPDCDVIIAGAGPAGAATAITLAQAGLHVILVDAQSFPRDKICGDFVSPVALQELRALGVTRRSEFKRSNVIHDAAIFLDGRHLLTSAIPGAPGFPAGRVIPRKTLDGWILARARAAGAQIREGCRVQAFTARRDGIEVSLQCGNGMRILRGRILIGADGSNSVVARSIRDPGALNDDRLIAVRGYFEGVTGPADQADLYFTTETFPGYCWLFPVGVSTANVGVGMVLKSLPPARDHLRTLLLRLIDADPALKRRLTGARLVGNIIGWPLTIYNGRLPVVDKRVLLVGDAAGLINPLNGEGIQYALLSARWAAETVIACAARGAFSQAALRAYATRIDTELGPDLTLSRAIVQLIRNRSLNPLWLEALQIIVARAAVDPDYAHLTGGVLAGVIPTRDLLSHTVVRKTLEQAAFRLGLRTVRALPLHPNGLARLGIDASQAALDIASTMLRHRADSERWAFNLATTALDFVGQKARRVATSTRSGVKPHRAGRATARQRSRACGQSLSTA